MNNSDSAISRAPLRGFWSLIITQFQGAFSDNILKNLVILLAIFAIVILAEIVVTVVRKRVL